MYYLTSPRFWFGIFMLGMSLFTFYQNMKDDEEDCDDGSTIASSIRTAPARSGARRLLRLSVAAARGSGIRREAPQRADLGSAAPLG